MCVKLDREVYCLLESSDQLCSLVGQEQTCHVLDTDGIGTHIFNSLCNVYPVVHCVGISQCVGKSHLCVRLLLVCRFDRSLQVAQIVHTVKDTDDINAVCHGLLYKVLYHIVCVGAVSQDVLSSEEHLELCVFKSIPELSKSVPGIFLQEAEGRVKCSAAPALYGVVTHLVHLVDDGQHLLCRHTGGDQRLMCVTQNGFCYFHWFFLNFCHCFFLHYILFKWPAPALFQSRRIRLLHHSEDSHKGSGHDRRTDDSGHVRSHGMHQKEVGWIVLRTHLLGYPGRHRHG